MASAVNNPLGFIKPIPIEALVVEFDGRKVPFERLTLMEVTALRDEFPVLNEAFGGKAPKMTDAERGRQGEECLVKMVAVAVAKAAGVDDAASLKAISASLAGANPNQKAVAGRVVLLASFPEAAPAFGASLDRAAGGQAPKGNRQARRAAAKPRASTRSSR